MSRVRPSLTSACCAGLAGRARAAPGAAADEHSVTVTAKRLPCRSAHTALSPFSPHAQAYPCATPDPGDVPARILWLLDGAPVLAHALSARRPAGPGARSEEHTSELQSPL